MLSAEQRRRTIAGIYASLEAIKDTSPLTDEERRNHDFLVRREIERKEKQISLELK